MKPRYIVLIVSCVALAVATPLNPDVDSDAAAAAILAGNSSAIESDRTLDATNGTTELRNDTAQDVAGNKSLGGVALFGEDAANSSSAVDGAPSASHEVNGTSASALESNGTHTAKSLDPASVDGDDEGDSNATKEPNQDGNTPGATQDSAPTTEKSAAGLREDDDKKNMVTVPAAARPLTPTPSRVTEPNTPTVLQLHPLPPGPDRIIRFRSGEVDDWKSYVDDLAVFLEPYQKEVQEPNVHCDFEKELHRDRACRFDLVYLGPSCTKQNNFGYGIGKPCVILSPAKIPGWVPAAYDNGTTTIPDEVQRLMLIFNANFLFVTCEGESDTDRANVGPMAYLPPYQGFPSYFFPYKGDTVPTYVAPLMAVEFLNPTNGTTINMVCKAWAKNVNDVPLEASLRFSLQVN